MFLLEEQHQWLEKQELVMLLLQPKQRAEQISEGQQLWRGEGVFTEKCVNR